ncbi:hypothetical protein CTEN210_01443 [Chaetoceros tenuissimus]|uniref:Suppressor of forked domain-containing protein n=1 Tax=Chaetoceros tenuissimus TaxID=426638 RepID=A0AAD3CHL1_9STRA|nr:hypothetical protein CTEN210_01443 [Chaetoceros tenuissimus]
MAESENAPKQSILLQGMDEAEDQDVDMQPSNTSAPEATMPSTSHVIITHQLISQIITPSPFQHHNDSGTADRYRSGLQRITQAPTRDVEAWEVIMNECTLLYRSQLLPQLDAERNKHKMMFQSSPSNSLLRISRSDELERQLDWVESCHGHLLKYFPYSSNYYNTILDMLLARSALPFESLQAGIEDDYSFGTAMNWVQSQTPLQIAAGMKIDAIFEFALGVKMDGTPASSELENKNNDETAMEADDAEQDKTEVTPLQTLSGMCTSSVELWLQYIQKRTRDARRQALQHHSVAKVDPTNPARQIIQLTTDGEELVRDWIVTAYETALNNGAAFAINNQLVWKQYLNFVKSWNVVATDGSGVNHALHTKQKELLRGIYQRLITLPMLGLDGLWKEYEAFERAQSEQLAVALIEEHQPKYQHARSVYLERQRVYSTHELRLGRLATPPVDFEFLDQYGNVKADVDEDDYQQKMKDEIELLAKWKRRNGYERTNPERLSPADLTIRIRQCYKDTVCCFMRHIEVWHEWSTWELLNPGAAGAGGSSSSASASKKKNAALAAGVLELGQKYIPDSTLLAYTHAQILENQHGDGRKTGSVSAGEEAIQVMRNFCKRAGNTLGYVILQRLVRKYKGVNEARAVFSEARRQLRIKPEDALDSSTTKTVHKSIVQEDGAQIGDDTVGQVDSTSTDASKGKMVMSRGEFYDNAETLEGITNEGSKSAKNIGFITWHLYASHATLEHRLNHLPKVASRVYELGLKKHRSFLSTPQFVLQYSSLLLELNDEENLRALLMRAISACEEQNELDGDDALGGNEKKLSERRELQRPLWDMMLKFESIISLRSGDLTSVQSLEARRRKALYGPYYENVAGGKINDDVGIGAQKASLSDTLIRTDGYENSSRIVNGLGRLVDSLEVTGILGEEPIASALSAFSAVDPGSVWKGDGCSGTSDASFRRRKLYQSEMESLSKMSLGKLSDTSGVAAASSSGRLTTARERLAQQNVSALQNSSVMGAVQSSPEWIRGMLMLLPATIRNYRGKAPPHMIDLALATLRENPLPPVRPVDENTVKINDTTSSKRQREDKNGDSSDEEDFQSSGYGSTFRARQKARLANAI